MSWKLKIDKDSGEWRILDEDTDNHDIVAVLSVTEDEDYDHEVTYPNALLMAAAPELLAALEGVMDNITSSVASRATAFKEATRVINKAKGIQ